MLKCTRNTISRLELEYTRITCGYNIIKMNLQIFNEKINFINGLKNDEEKVFSICIDVFKIYEGDDKDKKTVC